MSKIWDFLLRFSVRPSFQKKFSFSDGAVFEIFAIDKQNAFVAKGNLNFNVTIEMITIQKSIIVN